MNVIEMQCCTNTVARSPNATYKSPGRPKVSPWMVRWATSKFACDTQIACKSTGAVACTKQVTSRLQYCFNGFWKSICVSTILTKICHYLYTLVSFGDKNSFYEKRGSSCAFPVPEDIIGVLLTFMECFTICTFSPISLLWTNGKL